MGFGAVTREQEAATDRQLVTSGISPTTIWFGKTLALLGAASLILMPLIIAVALSGSAANIGLGFSALYASYLLAWVMIITAASTWSAKSSSSLLILIAAWLFLCVLTPRLLAGSASAQIAAPSKIEADMGVIVALRAIGDGHNANDPAFNRLRANLLEQYEVERVEDLPINFRGVVAQTAEADLTKILNEYSAKSMAKQVEQTALVKSLQIVSPFVALQSASMTAAGTDLRSHHRFLRQAEATRFEFVQGLNKVHADQMSYADDINRNKNNEAYDRTRMNPENWRVLSDFEFKAYPPSDRLALIKSSMFTLLLWSILAALLGYLGARRLPEINNG
jgi:ABC-2 type transport system permease protein